LKKFKKLERRCSTGRTEEADVVPERMEITDRDVSTLRWTAEWWGVTVSQVDRWWRLPAQVGLHGPAGPPRTEVARRRLAAMQRSGLLVAHRMPTSPAHIYAVTSAGLNVAGLATWTVPRWRWSQFRHEHTSTSAALDLLAAGFEVVSERRMRQDDALGAGGWSLVLPTSRGARSHYPDLWVRRDDTEPWRAVEIELARKSLSRLVAILAAYRDRGAGVTYYTADASVAQAVRRAAARARLTDLDVRRVASPTRGRPEPVAAGVGHG
jgi:hypothetical protein